MQVTQVGDLNPPDQWYSQLGEWYKSVSRVNCASQLGGQFESVRWVGRVSHMSDTSQGGEW